MKILTQHRKPRNFQIAVSSTSDQLCRPSARLWTHWNYFAFFWAVSFNPVAWNTGSSLISVGLVSFDPCAYLFVCVLIYAALVASYVGRNSCNHAYRHYVDV